ncbi:MAG: alcohol dehydrogenase catalytic domain-containing protein [Deltaproteobacteria bacterium]|nr:alcohol dehydrogenase catalytic domain-containing protein [Deltaproteobacteria bacterium]
MSTVELAEDDVAIELEASSEIAAGIGTVVAAGERAQVLMGKRVLVGPIDPCGECEVCRRGGGAVCPLARRRTASTEKRIVAAGRWVVALDDGLALTSGGAAVPGAVALAYTLYARTGVAPREPVVVVGASPVTRFLVEILLAKGLSPAVVANPAHDAWIDWLLGKGVTVARTTAVDEARATCIAAFAADGLGGRPWRVIVTSGEHVAVGAALAGPRATLTVLAPVASLPGELAAREVTVITVAGAHPDLVVEVAAMCVKGDIDLAAGTASAATPDHRAVINVP